MMAANTWDIAAPVPEPRRSLMSGPAPQPDPPVKRSVIVRPPVQIDFDQVGARVRRRAGWLGEIHYREFDLVAEVADQLRPLAVEIRGLRADGVRLADWTVVERLVEPLRNVGQIAASVHSLRLGLAKLLASVPVSVLLEGARVRLAGVVADRVHGVVPGVDEADLDSGSWVDVLVAHVEPLSADLSAVVAASASGVVSELDIAISEVLSNTSSTYGEMGLDQAVGLLVRRFPELRQRRGQVLQGRRFAADYEAEKERLRVERALRELRL